jgi:hypothetical protein
MEINGAPVPGNNSYSRATKTADASSHSSRHINETAKAAQ